ncbi:MerR family transcriptional regulator [Methylibium sp.]|uniref:MerR family transcriptional regulator n=1 Tax=Methylibium sp. TaxID=2067992 RepID=UPI00286CAC07|nr:MerR family transcriptional regulator [Methylibium sp.]
MRPITLSIAAVERNTGLSKDTLRVWERRYGFPTPGRDALAERAYPLDQVEKLRVIKRLMDAGHRPGRIVPQPLEELLGLCEHSLGATNGAGAVIAAPDLRLYIDLVRAHDVQGLRRQLLSAQLRLGLGRFVIEVLSPLNTLVGDTWMRGHLEIFEEHLYTEQIHAALRNALNGMPAPEAASRPRVLLTTFPNEPHSIGLLMAEVLLALEGCRCVSLGTQTPVWDIVLAATAQCADIVALSFTSVLTPATVTEGLAELRDKLPRGVEVWAGGAAPVLHRRPTPGVRALDSLTRIAAEAQRWRSERV